MEGNLKKWTNLISGWQNRYFILNNDILTYFDQKDGNLLGKVHLQASNIQSTAQDPLRIIIKSFQSEIHIKAKNLNEKFEWMECLRKTQDISILKQESHNIYDLIKEDDNLSNNIKEYFCQDNQKIIDLKLLEIWQTQVELQEKLSLIDTQSSFQNNSQLQNIDQIVLKIKQSISQMILDLDEEKKRLYNLIKTKASSQSETENLDITQFESFLLNDSILSQNLLKKKYFYYFRELNIEKSGFQCPIKQDLLKNNIVFQKIEISNQPKRLKLKYKKDPNQKINIWEILKSAVGKDLTKFAVPVQLNEPLSMLQKLSEPFQNINLLNKAAEQEDSLLKMAYVVAFSFALNALVINREKKPFNPLLGETFELITQDFKAISEQVSHHPPISAVHCENEKITITMDSNVKTKFWGQSIEVWPLGLKNIYFKQTNEHFYFPAPKTIVQNILVGKLYIDFYGEQVHTNSKTGEKGILNLKERGWNNRNAYEAEGYILDSKGTKKYLFQGKWNSYLNLINIETKEVLELWKNLPLPEDAQFYYFMTEFVINLNHLSTDILEKLPATDSRLRPDQRALEAGLFDLASSEKLRLEEKQRARRKEYEKINKHHEAKWFKETEYQYLGGYWEAREKGDFGDLLDLY